MYSFVLSLYVINCIALIIIIMYLFIWNYLYLLFYDFFLLFFIHFLIMSLFSLKACHISQCLCLYCCHVAVMLLLCLSQCVQLINTMLLILFII